VIEFTKLLGSHLKDDQIIQILESHKLDVVYDFDRLHEGMDDAYWAKAPEAGFLLRFNQDQILETVFLYMALKEGYAPAERGNIDIAVYQTFDEAERQFKANAIPYEVSSGEVSRDLKILGIDSMHKLWIKGDYGRYTAHYQFQDGRISMVTLQFKVSGH